MCIIFNQDYLPGGGNFIFTIFFKINLLVLKRDAYAGIRTLCVPIRQGQEPCPVATITYFCVMSDMGLVSRVRMAGCREHTYPPLCFSKESQMYTWLILSFGLRVVNSLKAGSPPILSCPLGRNLWDKMVSGTGRRPAWNKTLVLRPIYVLI